MRIILVILSLYVTSALLGQENTVWMHPNHGQWDDRIEYRVDLQMGKMYIEKDGFTYHFYEVPETHGEEHDHTTVPETLKNHVVKASFVDSDWGGEVIESETSPFYSNYFLGSDQTGWKSKVYSHGMIRMVDVYPDIDLIVSGYGGKLKYSFVVKPGADPADIVMQVDGADKMEVSNGELEIVTSLAKITEEQPVAWTVGSTGRKEVGVNFRLSGKKVKYELPHGYNHGDTLYIDPSLVFSSFTGSTTDNWGMTSTPGPNGEAYGGGISFGTGYPTTTGAYDQSYGGGTPNGNIPGFDVAISKFSPTGNTLLYSTYIGGGANELPESLISSETGELYVLGITASTNFPVTAGAYDQSFNGGPTESENSLVFVGSDLYVLKLSEDGTQLMASTYIGGSSNDGLNTTNLNFNYGDQFRGEITLDPQENVLVASHTRSSDFPVTGTSPLNGGQDAVVFKLSSSLANLIWSEYLGGSSNETANSLALSSSNELYVTGGTESSNFTLNGVDPTYDGGADGYLIRLDGATGAVLGGTYMGFAEYDQSYFVKLDIDDQVYVYGQSESPWPISPGRYGVPNSGQFIRKYNPDLSSVLWTTMIGAGSGHAEISPTAFLISDCYDIFIAGWGGDVNSAASQAVFSSSFGFPVTPGAFQTTTNGSNFYLGILSADAASLVYGTYMGGVNSSSNHVDGGTSRFDKSGAVYHAVCAACNGNDNGFTSTPGVWSPTNPSTNCNMAVFKFQLGLPYSIGPDATICQGQSTQLSASGGISYSWTPSGSLNNPNVSNPIATPSQTTVYYVNMDFNEGCAITDSVVVEVVQPPVVDLDGTVEICIGDEITLTASGGTGFLWSAENDPTVDGATTAQIQVSPVSSGYYYCAVSNQCFTTLDSIYVTVHPLPQVIASEDTTICFGDDALISVSGSIVQFSWNPDPELTPVNATQALVTPSTTQYFYATGTDAFGCSNTDSVFVDFFPIPDPIITQDTAICLNEGGILSASGLDSYSWSPPETLSSPNSSSTVASPLVPTMYYLTGTYATGCVLTDSVFVDILYLPVPQMPDSLIVCVGTSEEITVSGADSYSWSPSTYLNTVIGPVVVTSPDANITYVCAFTNVCGTVTEDIGVRVIDPEIEAYNDTIVCPGNRVFMQAEGGVSYFWFPPEGLEQVMGSHVTAAPAVPTVYYVTGMDIHGCTDTDSVHVNHFPHPNIQASPDQYLLEGDTAQLYAILSDAGTVSWYPTEYLSCVNCLNPVAYPPGDFSYTVTFTDQNGCVDTDLVQLYFEPLIYVPNTFTPNGIGANNTFGAKGGNIETFEMLIFNRWGEVVGELKDIHETWNGTYNGQPCQDGTYTWKITYSDRRGNEFELNGHVNVIR